MLRKLGAESIGTFALVFAGCGAIVVDVQTATIGHVGVSAVFGLVIAVMIYATGHISGAHFNPAVTLSFAAIGRFEWRDVPGYIAAQLAGALAGAGLLLLIFGSEGRLGSTHPVGAVGSSLALEVVFTGFLMFVITSVATDSRVRGGVAGMAIGGTVMLSALAAGPISGASLNPARSLAPALLAGGLADQWIYVAGPVAGALIGAFAYEFIRGEEGG